MHPARLAQIRERRSGTIYTPCPGYRFGLRACKSPRISLISGCHGDTNARRHRTALHTCPDIIAERVICALSGSLRAIERCIQMCIFSTIIGRVGSTRILVCDAPSHHEDKSSTAAPDIHKLWRQLTVYSNVVVLSASQPRTAMILPVPVRPDTRRVDALNCGIRVHDMPESSAKFFDTMKANLVNTTRGVSGPCIKLEVHRAGVYRFSIVPTVSDFIRVDDSVFKLETGSEPFELLAAKYPTGFAFLVCLIDETATLRPIAYEHDGLARGDFVVPTRHYHPHESSTAVKAANRPRSGRREVIHTDWDHEIYSIGASNRGSLCNTRPLDLARVMERGGVTGLPFRLPAIDRVAGVQMRDIGSGGHKNTDIILTRLTDEEKDERRGCFEESDSGESTFPTTVIARPDAAVSEPVSGFKRSRPEFSSELEWHEAVPARDHPPASSSGTSRLQLLEVTTVTQRRTGDAIIPITGGDDQVTVATGQSDSLQ